MTNDQFKVLLYGTALLGMVAFAKNEQTGKTYSLPTTTTSSAPYSWWQQCNRHIKPQDSPWIWLDDDAHAQQISQKKTKKTEETSSSQQPAQAQPVKKDDRVYNETSPTDGVEMMEKMRQFRLERLEEQADDEPVSL